MSWPSTLHTLPPRNQRPREQRLTRHVFEETAFQDPFSVETVEMIQQCLGIHHGQVLRKAVLNSFRGRSRSVPTGRSLSGVGRWLSHHFGNWRFHGGGWWRFRLESRAIGSGRQADLDRRMVGTVPGEVALGELLADFVGGDPHNSCAVPCRNPVEARRVLDSRSVTFLQKVPLGPLMVCSITYSRNSACIVCCSGNVPLSSRRVSLRLGTFLRLWLTDSRHAKFSHIIRASGLMISQPFQPSSRWFSTAQAKPLRSRTRSISRQPGAALTLTFRWFLRAIYPVLKPKGLDAGG